MSDRAGAGRRWPRLRRFWCAMYGHRIVFPTDIWADLRCRRCDWHGPSVPTWPPTIDSIEKEIERG